MGLDLIPLTWLTFFHSIPYPRTAVSLPVLDIPNFPDIVKRFPCRLFGQGPVPLPDTPAQG